MNSTWIKENIVKYLDGIVPSARVSLMRLSAEYAKAGGKGEPEKFRDAYRNLLTAIQTGEQVSGVRLIDSPDGSFLCALNAVSAVFMAVRNKVNTISFGSVQQANEWLGQKSNLILTDMKIETRTGFGLLANHSNIAKITLSYRAGDGKQLYDYRISVQEKTNLFFRRGYKNYASQWEAENPGEECVFLQRASNSRGSPWAQLLGFGLKYAEHVKFFIAHRKPCSAA